MWILILILFSYSSKTYACTVTMGYRTNANPPFIAQAPNNSGIYKDLYSKALKKIGCKLNIVREEKEAILGKLRLGLIDFYPGMDVNKERLDYLFFIKNYLPGDNIGISNLKMWEVLDIEAMEKKKILLANGGINQYSKANNSSMKVSELTLTEAINHISAHKADFYITNRVSVEYFLRQNPNIVNIKLHPECCLNNDYSNLGFSLSSMFIKTRINKNYLPRNAISIDNLPTILNKNSIAYKLEKSLEELFISGETSKIFNHYFFYFENSS